MRFFVGMSGWTFEGWRKGEFYPKGLPQKAELEFASSKVSSIEINGTFYRIQKPTSFRSWYKTTPKEGFTFSLKAPQFITHIRRVVNVETPVANFFASGIFALKEKLGPILWQFPPSLTLKDDRFDRFVKLLPKTLASAKRVAAQHSDWLEGSAVLSTTGVTAIRHAFELRHPSFFVPSFLDLLKENGIAVVHAHGGDPKLFCETQTADFRYYRMHGEGKAYAKGYSEKELRKWLKELPPKSDMDIFVYFNSENKSTAPRDALKLLDLLKTQGR